MGIWNKGLEKMAPQYAGQSSGKQQARNTKVQNKILMEEEK